MRKHEACPPADRKRLHDAQRAAVTIALLRGCDGTRTGKGHEASQDRFGRK